MELKVCKKCGIEKELNLFGTYKYNGKIYYEGSCRECRLKRRYEIHDKDYYKNKYDKYKSKNYEKVKAYSDNYYKEHKEEIQHKRLVKKYEDIEKYHENNKRAKRNQYLKNKNNEELKYATKIRNLIWRSFYRTGQRKRKHTEEILGCSVLELKEHLKETFAKNYGYEWDEKEKVHIDHIIPLSTARSEEDVNKLCHYTNLQLLKEFDNISKHNKIDWKLERKK